MRIGLNGQVLTAARGTEIGTRRTPSPAVGCRRLVIADPFLLCAVEIRVGRDAGLDGCRHHRVAQRRAHWVRYMQRPADAVKIIGAALLVLCLLEKRQNRIPIPAFAATLAPAIVVARCAAHIDHAVDRTGAAQNLATRLIKGTVVELLFRLALEHPVHVRIGEGLGVAERNVNPWIAVTPAGFEQQDTPAAAFAEPPGNGTSRRSRAGYNE